MRLITGDECGLLKEVLPEMGRSNGDTDDDPNTPIKPYHMDLADKVTKVGSKRLDPNEQQTRQRGVVDLTWMKKNHGSSPTSGGGNNSGIPMDDDDNDNSSNTDHYSQYQFAALRRNGSVQFWSASRDNVQQHGRYSVVHSTSNIFSKVWDNPNNTTGSTTYHPLALGYLPKHGRLCAADTVGNIVVLNGSNTDNNSNDHCGNIVNTFNAYQTTKRGTRITYTPGSFENKQIATTMAVHPIDGRIAIGGRERETSLLDVESGQLVWKAKNLPPDPQTLLQQPVWPTAITFLGGPTSNIMAVGTAYKEIRLYDVRESSKVRRPTAVTPEGLFEYRITSVCPLQQQRQKYDTTETFVDVQQQLVVGDAAGFLYQLDLRKLGKNKKAQAHKDLGRFVGPGGSVRQIQLHPTKPRMAVVGLDRMLRIYDTNTRKQLDCVYLKQRLNTVLFHPDDDWDLARKAAEENDDENDDEDDEYFDIDDDDRVIGQDDVVQDYIDSDEDGERSDDDDDDNNSDESMNQEDENVGRKHDGDVSEIANNNSSDSDDSHDSKSDNGNDNDDLSADEGKSSQKAYGDTNVDGHSDYSEDEESDGSDDNDDDSNESQSDSDTDDSGSDGDSDDDSDDDRGHTTKSKEETPKPQMKKRKEVQVVKCPSAFPISARTAAKKRQRGNEDNESKTISKSFGSNGNSEDFLDFHETAKEVRAYGATAFVGQQKRDYADEKYFELTGRHKKKHQVPLPIVRGIKKARDKREAREREEARAAGIVLGKRPSDSASKNRKTYDRTYDKFGPAPSIGFTKNGVFRVKGKGNDSKRTRR